MEPFRRLRAFWMLPAGTSVWPVGAICGILILAIGLLNTVFYMAFQRVS